MAPAWRRTVTWGVMDARSPGDDASDDGDATGGEARPDDPSSTPPDADVHADAGSSDGDGARSGDEGDPEGEVPTRPRPLLDGRTLVICALVALIAALAAGLLVSGLTDSDEAVEAAPLGELVPAEEAPEVTLTRFDGTEVRLADYLGQPLVVNFWSSTCQPCVEEMPDLQAVHASLGEQVTFLGVNTQDAPEAAQAMAERTGVRYDLVQDVDGELSRALDVATLPVTVLILPDGTVVDTIRRRVSSERLCDKIDQALLGGRLEECG